MNQQRRPWRMIATVFAAIFGIEAHAVTITFDTDASGNPLTAPGTFFLTTPLTTLYAPLGVTFSGPTPSSGGAILDQSAGFGLNALSGTNFLAFNRFAGYANGGQPTDPETISFRSPVTTVSIFAAGGTNVDTFLLQAFNSANVLVASDTISTQGFAQLQVSGSDIVRVMLTQVGDSAFVYDNLSFTFGIAQAPEPATLGLLAVGLAGLAFGRRRFTRAG